MVATVFAILGGLIIWAGVNLAQSLNKVIEEDITTREV